MLRKLCREIEEAGGDDYIFSLIVEGMTIEDIGEILGVSRQMVYDWRDRGGEERKKQWSKAMRMKADWHAEQSSKALGDIPPLTAAEARWRSDWASEHKWHAMILNREKYGEQKPQADVNISIGALHLDALRQRGSMALPGETREPEVIEAEVLDTAEGAVVEEA